MIEQGSIQAAGGYGPPGGGYGGPPGGPPPGGGYGPPPGGSPPGGGFGPPGGGAPPGGGYGGPPGNYFGGPPPGGFGGSGFGGPPMGPTMGEPSKGLAIGALVLGILSIPGACCCYSSIPLGISAIVIGVIALGKVKESPHMYAGGGMARGGLICGIIGIVLTMVAVLFGIGASMLQQL